MTTPTNLGNEAVRRLTITERPGYEPDGYGFARRVEDKLFGMALVINKREQEQKLMADETNLVAHTDTVTAAFSAPETLTAQLRRLRFEIQTTQTRLAEADKLIEKVLAGL